MHPFLHSSADYGSLTHCTSIWWNTTSSVGARSYTELNYISNWRKQLKAPLTHLLIVVTMEQNRSRSTEDPTLIFRVAVRALSVGPKPITLVLMMINSYSYCSNDLVFNKFQIFNQDLSRCLASIKDSRSSFEASTCWFKSSRFKDSIKYSKESSSWITFGSSLLGEENFQKKIFEKTCVMFVSVKDCF